MIFFYRTIGLVGSISGRVIPHTQKIVFNGSLLIIQHYKVFLKSKVDNSGKAVVFALTPLCSSYWKGSLWVAFNNGLRLYLCFFIEYWYPVNKRFDVVNIFTDIIWKKKRIFFQTFKILLLFLKKARQEIKRVKSGLRCLGWKISKWMKLHKNHIFTSSIDSQFFSCFS